MSDILNSQAVTRKPKRRLHFLIKKIRKPLVGSFYLASTLFIGAAAWLSVTHSGYFSLKKIEVAGDFHILNMQDILNVTKVPLGTNLFKIPLKEVENEIMKLAWVQSVSVRRQAPHILWIHVKEQIPKAILLADKLYFVSTDAVVFKEVEKEETRDLPVLTGFRKEDSLTDAVKLIDFFEGDHDFGLFGLSEIHYNEAVGFSIVTLTGPMEIKLGRENFEIKLNRLKNIWNHLKPKVGVVRGMDLDYDDKAFVKI